MDALGIRDWLQLIALPLLGLVLTTANATRAELTRVRERLAAVEKAVEIGLGVRGFSNQRRGGDS